MCLFNCAFFISLKRMNEVFFLSENNRTMANARLLAAHEDIFICPICSNPVKVVDLKSLICSNHHCFDISKQGYVNLLSHPLRTKYDRKLFESRAIISQNGVFDPLIARICKIMVDELGPTSTMECIKILDAGCGEGSHLPDIQQRIHEQSQHNLLGLGMDISKDGIRIASRRSSRAIWCVADLAQCPFKDNQFDFILNILSPSNYSEFHRMLADDGMVIKVIPERKYLQELRGMFYRPTDKMVYSNEHTVELFSRKFKVVDIQRVQYSVTIDQKYMGQLVHMTPLSWGASQEQIQQILGMHKLEVTMDFSVLLGKKE
ncbi:putative RNA methyltransferase [Paenibacillus aurantiacus]|uniref:RNA methyltransferase n=1 Tax=Paenibacillus aurantiacus TaxID=1936118 RepID=A0ABV5KSY6_9BACL